MDKKHADKELKKHLSNGYKGTQNRKVGSDKKIIPLGDRLYVRQFQENTNQAVVIPDRADMEKKSQGVVEAIGEGENVQKLGLKIGEMVIYAAYSGDILTVDGDKNEYRIIDHDQIIAVVR